MKITSLFTRTLLLTAITFVTHNGSAQEPIPREDMEKVVPRFVQRAADLENPQIKTTVVAAKAFGMKVKHYAAVIIPDQGLTKEALEKAGTEILPLGQLWLNKLSPAVGSASTPSDKLRIVSVAIKDEDVRIPLLLLGARKTADGSLELVIYAKAQEPLLTLPLKPFSDSQELPLTVDMHQGSATLGEIDIKVLGQYRATLRVGELE